MAPRADITAALARAELPADDAPKKPTKEQQAKAAEREADILQEALLAFGDDVPDDTRVDALRLRYALAAAHTHAAMLQAETSDVQKEKGDLLAPISVAFLTETLLPAARILGNGILIEGFGTVDATERQRAHALAVETARHSTSRPGLSYRVRYNMACFWSTWLEHRKTPDVTFDGRTPDAWGLHELELALSGATRARQAKRLATWARRDPSLAPLKATRRDAFTNTLDRY